MKKEKGRMFFSEHHKVIEAAYDDEEDRHAARETMMQFAYKVFDKIRLSSGEQVTLYLSPLDEFKAFQIVEPGKTYKKGMVKGVLCIIKDKTLKKEFPYFIYFTKKHIAFDADGNLSVNDAVQVVYDVLERGNFGGVTTQPQRNLVKRYVSPIMDTGLELD